jgi:UDP-N-acetylglucosamine transferase subunit ALG13
MIFVTVGTDLPFDRMMKVVDEWARQNRRRDVFAQIGKGGWEPGFIEFTHFLEPPAFRERFNTATLIISHAGMGTILSALLHGKPILVMPKLASLGEHRNEHQTATARRMSEFGGVNVAFDEHQLRERLDHLDNLTTPVPITEYASQELLEGLREFIHRR